MTITEYLERRIAETESDIAASISSGKARGIIKAQRNHLSAINEAIALARGEASFDSLSLGAQIVYLEAEQRALGQ